MKKYNYQKIFALLFLFYFNNIFTININVLLFKQNINEYIGINLKEISAVEDLENKEYYSTVPPNCILEYINGSWFLNQKKLIIQNLNIIPLPEKCIFYNNNEYEGKIFITIKDNFIYIINEIDIESYVKSVVAKEVFSNWTAESLEVAAITARTYAIHLRNKAIKNKKIFHIKNSIEHQKYNGKNLDTKIQKAVTKTKNKIIIDKKNKTPILAMYHVCCGGVIPIQCTGFDFDKHPYLKRTKKCVGCENYKQYNWQKYFSYNQIIEKLQEILQKTICKIKKIKKIIYAKSGTVRKILMDVEMSNQKNKKNRNVEIILNHKTIRKLFNITLSINSSYFNINFDNKFNAEVNGKGQGHHIGLCQRGMEGYSKQGKSAEEIIFFYYPETIISDLLLL